MHGDEARRIPETGDDRLELGVDPFGIRGDDVREHVHRVVDGVDHVHDTHLPRVRIQRCNLSTSFSTYFLHRELTVCKSHPRILGMSENAGSRPVYSMAVAAELLGLPAATLRLYERKGLLTPARTEGGTRRYSADDIDRMRRVSELQDDGVNLAGIGKVLDLEGENAALRQEAADRAGDTV